jgi:hypothetical protein
MTDALREAAAELVNDRFQYEAINLVMRGMLAERARIAVLAARLSKDGAISSLALMEALGE